MNKCQLRECSLGSNKGSAPFALGQNLLLSPNNMEEKYSQNAYQIFACHQIGKTMKTKLESQMTMLVWSYAAKLR